MNRSSASDPKRFEECLFGCGSLSTRCTCVIQKHGPKHIITSFLVPWSAPIILSYLRWCSRCHRELTDSEGACWVCLRYIPLQNLPTPQRILCSPDRIQPSLDPRDAIETRHGVLLRYTPFPQPLLPFFQWQNQVDDDLRPDFLTVYCTSFPLVLPRNIVLDVSHKMTWKIYKVLSI